LPLTSEVRDTFDRLAAEYDELKLRVIPDYSRIQAFVHRYAVTLATPGRVLELGCGTAQWAAAFLQKHPSTYYTAIEFSNEMRRLATARLEPFSDRIELVDRDLNSPLPEGVFDVVVSFFAVHHVEDKRGLARDVFDHLTPEGAFLYADITVGNDPSLEQRFIKGWVDFMREAGLEEERIPHVLADHRQNDLPESAEQQLKYLREAGFASAEIVWRWEKFALFHALKRGDVSIANPRSDLRRGR
jgi:tRNA (cmo5U34)-methyltransferase